MISEIAKRYARAFFDCASDAKKIEHVAKELAAINTALNANNEALEFIHSPVIAPTEKKKVLIAAAGSKTSEETQNLISVLVDNNRIDLFPEIYEAFEAISDEVQGVTRGVVKSVVALNQDDRQRIERTIAKATNKKVILDYEEDKNLLGGMVARVGGWTFDDSLKTHLTRLSEDLNRSEK